MTDEKTGSTGPLAGVRVVEMAAIGPAPFAGMLLSDLGADVVRVDRPPGKSPAPYLTPLDRGRRSIAIDLKSAAGTAAALKLVSKADILIEGFRPGVMERLGFGPTECLAANPRLVYGRMTGFGQTGRLSGLGGHDINYIALTGALDLIGDADGPPLPPQNLLGDFGGGGMLLAVGVLSALHHARATGEGQVVDAAMVDGVSSLLAMHFGLRARGVLGSRGGNGLGGGSPYYCAYRTADGGWMAVGAIEEPFYAALIRTLGLDGTTLPDRTDHRQWPVLKERLAEAFSAKTREEWTKTFATVDACVTPVLTLDEVEVHEVHTERRVFQEIDGIVQPSPAPRFDRTPGVVQGPPAQPGEHTTEILEDWGFAPDTVRSLRDGGAIWSSSSPSRPAGAPNTNLSEE
jgi:alpha-methylacyl-CoA racemase